MLLHDAPVMKTHTLSLFFGLSILSLSCFAGCAAPTADDADGADEEAVESEEAITSGPSNFGYFIVTRRDYRRCVAPLCGGFYVKRVNEAKTRCADGSLQPECYVSAIQLTGIGLSDREESELRTAVESGKALVKARTYKKKWNGIWLGTLKANEGWLGATGSVDGTFDGTFYRAADNGIRCITAPCPSTTAYPLNGAGDPTNLVKVNLTTTANPADAATLDRATAALGTKEGILVAGGVALPKCLPGSKCGPFLTASEFYVRVTHTEGKACGARNQTLCNEGQFCAWKDSDICGAFDAGGTCQYKPQACPMFYDPVCACDGKTYGNACSAAAAGASVSSKGECAK
jgi:hypothetical protein